jgi:hypothetical protein
MRYFLSVMIASMAISGWLGTQIAVSAANPGQTIGPKTVDVDIQTRMDAVTISEVTVGNQLIRFGVSAGAKEINPGTPFQAGEDWLQNTSIFLKNRTNKPIVDVVLGLYFPETGDGMSPSTPVTEYVLDFGRRPDIDSFLRSGRYAPPDPSSKPLIFLPGEVLVIHLSDYIGEIQSMVGQKMPLAQVTRCNISRTHVYFDDGMMWSAGDGFSIPSPDHSGKFVALDRGHYFPGHPSENWPPGQ